ncbi:MAG: glucose-6-phosphate isomerase, partial [Planctomycetales bacterium]|nr:glucose-6-phosphate isomerase [Planctomycetales bacterium]
MPSLRYDYAAALLPDYGINQGDLDQLAPLLEAARNEVLQVDKQLYESKGAIPAEKQPLDAGFVEMPERILAAYRSDRQGSELGRILKTAERIRERCDRVVVLGIGGSYMGAKALMDTCCHPFHNEMSRADRGGRPRIYFEGNNVDNDSANGLLDLLRTESTGDAANWAIVVISKSGGTLETAVSFRVFLDALSVSVGGDTKQLADLVVPVTGSSGKLFDLATELGCPEIFEVPDGVGGRFSVLSAVGLLPAAIMGLDV